MPDLISCTRCGAQLRPHRSQGLCTRCLLETGLDSPPESPDVELSAPTPLGGPSNESENFPPNQAVVRYFGDYELIEQIGRGGMGVVYRAKQVSLNRFVAVKMLLHGEFSDAAFVRRFKIEAEVVAQLDHPHIVPIYEIGEHDGQHYFSMKLLEGGCLAERIEGCRSPIRDAKAESLNSPDRSRSGVGEKLRERSVCEPFTTRDSVLMLASVARAVHYAHQRGVLHRDLKPHNILLDQQRQPHLTDFGLAKLLEQDTGLTVSEAVMGSPAFMSPEQAAGKTKNLTTAADVYSLGAVLYALLTGRPPFQAPTPVAALRKVIDTEPVKPSQINRELDLDLETICLKCLEKEPERRYGSAEALADDLERWLRSEPVLARPASTLDRARKWTRRNPALAFLGAALVMVFTLGMILTLWQWRQAVHNAYAEAKLRQLFEENSKRLDQDSYDSDMNLAQHAWDEGDLGQTLSFLQAHQPGPGQRDLRGFEWFYFRNLCRGDPATTLPGHNQAVNSVAFSPDGKRMATGSMGDPVQVWDCATGKIVAKLPEQNVVSLAFSPDSQMLGVGGRNQLAVWNLETKQQVFELVDPPGQFYVLFTPQGTSLLVGRGSTHNFHDGGHAELWNYATHEKICEFPQSGGYIALSPRGDLLATANSTNIVRIWDLASRLPVSKFDTGGAIAMAFSSDGRTLATSGWNSGVDFWDVATARYLGWLTNSLSRVWSLSFSPKDGSLATGGADQTVSIWDVTTLQRTEQLRGHGAEVMSVAFSPDGQTLASGSRDNTAKLWSTHPNRALAVISNVVSRPVFSQDSRLVIAGIDQNRVGVWDVATLQLKHIFDDASNAAAVFSDGTNRLVLGASYFPNDFDWTTMAYRKTIAEGRRSYVDLSPDGKTLVVGFADGALKFLDAKSGSVIANIAHAHPDNIFQFAFSPNGKFLASVGRGDSTGNGVEPKIWNIETHEMVARLIGHTEVVLSVALSPDGKIVATCSVDNSIRFWDTTTWKEIPPLIGQKDYVGTLTFSPNGRTLATAGSDGAVKFWNVATRRELASLKISEGVSGLVFSADGQTLAMWCADFSLRLLRAPVSE